MTTESNFIIDTNLTMVDHERIKEMIPHRYPFLLVDKVVNMKPKESAVGIKGVTCNEPFFVGHFPKQAVMPGVLLVESMAQTAAILVVHTLGAAAEGKLVYFMSVENARFRKPVVPGDQLHVHVKVIQHRANVWKFDGDCKVDGKTVAEATFAAMIMG